MRKVRNKHQIGNGPNSPGVFPGGNLLSGGVISGGSGNINPGNTEEDGEAAGSVEGSAGDPN